MVNKLYYKFLKAINILRQFQSNSGKYKIYTGNICFAAAHVTVFFHKRLNPILSMATECFIWEATYFNIPRHRYCGGFVLQVALILLNQYCYEKIATNRDLNFIRSTKGICSSRTICNNRASPAFTKRQKQLCQ